MMNAMNKASFGLGAVALAAAGMLCAPNTARAAEAPAINNGAVTLDVSVDAATEYWFRGIAQENQGLIIQPGATVTFAISDGLDAYVGTWNSLHFDNPTTDADNNDWFYESDMFAGIAFDVLDGMLGVDISYVNYYGPAGGDEFAEEIDIVLSYNDSDLAPYALFAFEIDGGADGGSEKGIYAEFGLEPSFDLMESESYPITLSVPLTVGLSLDDYYEDPVSGDDETFGFFQVGAVLSSPLNNVPSEYGSWEAYVGVYYLMLGDATENIGAGGGAIHNGDSDVIYGMAGISMSY